MTRIMLIIGSLGLMAAAPQDPGAPPATDAPPASVLAVDPEQAARDACRGAVHRRIGESTADCVTRLIASGDALRPPSVPAARPVESCRRETRSDPDGSGFRFDVSCTTTVTVRPPSDDD